eukprot:27713_3
MQFRAQSSRRKRLAFAAAQVRVNPVPWRCSDWLNPLAEQSTLTESTLPQSAWMTYARDCQSSHRTPSYSAELFEAISTPSKTTQTMKCGMLSKLRICLITFHRRTSWSLKLQRTEKTLALVSVSFCALRVHCSESQRFSFWTRQLRPSTWKQTRLFKKPFEAHSKAAPSLPSPIVSTQSSTVIAWSWTAAVSLNSTRQPHSWQTPARSFTASIQRLIKTRQCFPNLLFSLSFLSLFFFNSIDDRSLCENRKILERKERKKEKKKTYSLSPNPYQSSLLPSKDDRIRR